LIQLAILGPLRRGRVHETTTGHQASRGIADLAADALIALGRAHWLSGDHKAALASWRAARGLDLLEPDIASPQADRRHARPSRLTLD